MVIPARAAGMRDGKPPLWYQGSRGPDDPAPGLFLSPLGNREVENLLIPRGTWSAWIRSMREAVIVGAVRTPIGKRGGALKDWRPDDLAAFALRALVDRAGIEPKLVEDVVLGCVTQGRCRREMAPVAVFEATGQKRLCDADEHPRRTTSLEKLASLPPAFKPDGRITAGNSSGINDGACGILVTNPETAKNLEIEPRARVVSTGVVGTNPTIMLDGTIPAIRKALGGADLRVDDIDLWEVNEAFASVPIATRETIGFEDSKLNVNGGAIGLGHPLGMSGARLITTMLHEMERQDLHRGLATLCIGFGMGVATIIERPI